MNCAAADSDAPGGCRDSERFHYQHDLCRSRCDGDDFAKRFGGTSGDDPDWFKITAYGTDANGNVVPGAPEFYLADFRAADHVQDYIVDTWTQFDLLASACARKVHFNVSSTDVHPDFGLNTPAFFAIDDLVYTIANTAPSLNIAPDTQLDAIAEDQTDLPAGHARRGFDRRRSH